MNGWAVAVSIWFGIIFSFLLAMVIDYLWHNRTTKPIFDLEAEVWNEYLGRWEDAQDRQRQAADFADWEVEFQQYSRQGEDK